MDKEIEADKDSLIFDLMKQKAADEHFWKNNVFFQEDGCFTCEQTNFIRETLMSLKFYVKKALQDNREKGCLDGLTYRLHKFYDIILGLLVMFTFIVSSRDARGGNDPGSPIWLDAQAKFNIAPLTIEELTDGMQWSKENGLSVWINDLEGNDPGLPRAIRRWQDQADDLLNLPEARIATPDLPTFYACHNDVISSDGFLPNLQTGCLDIVKRATTDVCVNFGDIDFCSLSQKAKDIMDKKYLE